MCLTFLHEYRSAINQVWHTLVIRLSRWDLVAESSAIRAMKYCLVRYLFIHVCSRVAFLKWDGSMDVGIQHAICNRGNTAAWFIKSFELIKANRVFLFQRGGVLRNARETSDSLINSWMLLTTNKLYLFTKLRKEGVFQNDCRQWILVAHVKAQSCSLDVRSPATYLWCLVLHGAAARQLFHSGNKHHYSPVKRQYLTACNNQAKKKCGKLATNCPLKSMCLRADYDDAWHCNCLTTDTTGDWNYICKRRHRGPLKTRHRDTIVAGDTMEFFWTSTMCKLERFSQSYLTKPAATFVVWCVWHLIGKVDSVIGGRLWRELWPTSSTDRLLKDMTRWYTISTSSPITHTFFKRLRQV